MREIHLFEPSGYAGVFQHAYRLGQLLDSRGLRVVLHTGHEHEPVPTSGVEVCPCSWWPRWTRRGMGRSASIALRFVIRTAPHLLRATRRGAVLHVEGIAAGGALTLCAVAFARLAGRRVVYSPHDTFSRRGPVDDLLLRLAVRTPHAVIVHSQADVRALGALRVRAHFAPLVQLVPAPEEARRRRWREEWRVADGEQVVLFAGYMRPEKRLDLLIRSAGSWPDGRKLAIVGEDRGAWHACARLARRQGTAVAARVGFVELEEFIAALSAADVVVAPHEKASQSGVLSLAAQLGVPTVAADVGGLGELASRTFAPGETESLTQAIEAELAGSRRPRGAVDETLAVQAHLEAYGCCVPPATDVGSKQGPES